MYGHVCCVYTILGVVLTSQEIAMKGILLCNILRGADVCHCQIRKPLATHYSNIIIELLADNIIMLLFLLEYKWKSITAFRY